INYGYQRFNAGIMIATVIVLIILVQLIQMVGDHLAKRCTHY
ncbi:methionine ABC transporter permease, partial [Legionella pneumophila serogroup 1]